MAAGFEPIPIPGPVTGSLTHFDEPLVTTYPIAFTVSSVLFALSPAFAPMPPCHASLIANPVFTNDCAQRHGEAEGHHRRPISPFGKNCQRFG
jgi:hypothetical protein